MGALAGPTAIGTNGQITVPKMILQELGWAGGDRVMFSVSEDDPEVLTVVPRAVFERRYRSGEDAEKLMRQAGKQVRTRAAPSEERLGADPMSDQPPTP